LRIGAWTRLLQRTKTGTLGDNVRILPRLFLLILGPITSASADVTYYSYKALRNWNIPGGDTTVVFVFTVLFAASVWFVARGIWLKDRTAQRRNWILAALTFVPAVVLVLMHAQ
jgi:hypothetical protein